jgi:hypothetical protein
MQPTTTTVPSAQLTSIPTTLLASDHRTLPSIPSLPNSTPGTDAPSSDENGDLPEDDRLWAVQDEEDARNAIAISISPTQARLASPATPAAEKAAALRYSSDYFFPQDTDDILARDEVGAHGLAT